MLFFYDFNNYFFQKGMAQCYREHEYRFCTLHIGCIFQDENVLNQFAGTSGGRLRQTGGPNLPDGRSVLRFCIRGRNAPQVFGPSTNLTCYRRYGRVPQGRRVDQTVPLHNGPNVTLIAALTSGGVGWGAVLSERGRRRSGLRVLPRPGAGPGPAARGRGGTRQSTRAQGRQAGAGGQKIQGAAVVPAFVFPRF